MKKTYKQKWLNALQSGEFKQGTDQLVAADGKSFCCLGVLLKTMGHSNKFIRELDDGDDDINVLLPESVLDKCGLTGVQQLELARLNDHGASFEDIAQHIAENY